MHCCCCCAGRFAACRASRSATRPIWRLQHGRSVPGGDHLRNCHVGLSACGARLQPLLASILAACVCVSSNNTARIHALLLSHAHVRVQRCLRSAPSARRPPTCAVALCIHACHSILLRQRSHAARHAAGARVCACGRAGSRRQQAFDGVRTSARGAVLSAVASANRLACCARSAGVRQRAARGGFLQRSHRARSSRGGGGCTRQRCQEWRRLSSAALLSGTLSIAPLQAWPKRHTYVSPAPPVPCTAHRSVTPPAEQQGGGR